MRYRLRLLIIGQVHISDDMMDMLAKEGFVDRSSRAKSLILVYMYLISIMTMRWALPTSGIIYIMG